MGSRSARDFFAGEIQGARPSSSAEGVFGAEIDAPTLGQSARKYVFDPIARVASFVVDETDGIAENAREVLEAAKEAGSTATEHAEGAAGTLNGHWETVKDEESGCNYYVRRDVAVNCRRCAT